MKLLFLLLLSLVLQLTTVQSSYAAYPIEQEQGLKKNNQSYNARPRYVGNPHSEDMGIFGILAIIFAVTGLFPLAIAAGIIGTQNGRKFKCLAKAGLLFGIMVGMLVAGYLLYLFVLG